MKKLLILIVILCFVFTSCASIMSGSQQKISFSTKPADASITIKKAGSPSAVFSGKTPVEVKLDRGDGFFEKAEYIVTIEKEGYEPVEYTMQANLNGGWYIAGNFLLGGLIGWLIVDPATGAMWAFDKEYHNELSTALSYKSKESDSMLIALADNVSPELLKKGKLIQSVN